MSTVCADQEVEGHFNFRRTCISLITWLTTLKPGFVVAKISTREFVVEEYLHVRSFVEFIEESVVKCPSVNSIDCLTGVSAEKISRIYPRKKTNSPVDIVCLGSLPQLSRTVSAMDHPTIHWNRLIQQLLNKARPV